MLLAAIPESLKSSFPLLPLAQLESKASVFSKSALEVHLALKFFSRHPKLN